MNILFLFEWPINPNVGGVQRVTDVLSKGLKEKGHSIIFLSTSRVEEDESIVFSCPQYFLDLSTLSWKSKYQCILDRHCINVIINQEVRPNTLEILKNTPINIKRITCFHTLPFLVEGRERHLIKNYNITDIKSLFFYCICRLYPKYFSNKIIEKEKTQILSAYELSDKLCFLSPRYFERVIKRIPQIDKKKLISISNPCSFKQQDVFLNKKKIILWVGRHDNASKNFEAFVDFWVYFKKLNSDWIANVLGSGPDLEHNMSYARNHKVNDMQFLGNIVGVETYYKESSILCMTSVAEGFPMVLLESMCYSCIPIAYDTFESIHDIIDNGINGIIIPPYNNILMARTVSELIQDSKKMESFRYECVKKVKKFSIENIVGKWHKELYNI